MITGVCQDPLEYMFVVYMYRKFMEIAILVVPPSETSRNLWRELVIQVHFIDLGRVGINKLLLYFSWAWYQ